MRKRKEIVIQIEDVNELDQKNLFVIFYGFCFAIGYNHIQIIITTAGQDIIPSIIKTKNCMEVEK